MPHSTRTLSPLTAAGRRPSRAFTLVEMLIVIAIISIIILIAVPSFKAMTGGRSVEAGANNLSALIGRARLEAIGLQRTSGVLFYMDQPNDRVAAILVREVQPPPDSNAPAGVVYLDLAPNGEYTLLPTGVGLNTFNDCAYDTTGDKLRRDDGYIGFNKCYTGPNFTTEMSATVPTRVGGAILFDGAGRLSIVPYRLLLASREFSTSGTALPTELAKVLSTNRGYSSTQTMGKTCTGLTTETVSSPGFVLFDLFTFRDTTSVSKADGTPSTAFVTTEADGDGNGNLNATPTSAMTTDEKWEEAWIDQNGTPFIVSRYSGALMRNR